MEQLHNEFLDTHLDDVKLSNKSKSTNNNKRFKDPPDSRNNDINTAEDNLGFEKAVV